MRFLAYALLLVLVLLPDARLLAADEPPEPPDPVGTWRGELKPLQLVLRIRQENGGYTATIDGFGAGQRNLKVENLILVEDVVSFQVPLVEGRFAGNVYGDSIRGIWSRGEESRTLIFFRD